MSEPLSHATLKAKQRAIRADFPRTMGLRAHRAISWVGRAEACGEDDDARFIFLWIAFNAAYADEQEFQAVAPGERAAFVDYFGRLVALDGDQRIYKALWQRFSGPVRMLMENRYVFNPFWQYHNPRGLQCSNRNMADWDEGRNKIEGEANTFASYLLMPLDDFREQIKGRIVDIDVMTELADRYAVSLTAAILKWMTITDKRAMIVVGKEGFIDWAWSSEPLLKSGIFYRARQIVTELPAASLAAQEVDWDTGRHGSQHPAGGWLGNEPVREMTVFSPGNEMSISLLLYPDQAPSRWEMAELEEEATVDTFDKFMGGSGR